MARPRRYVYCPSRRTDRLRVLASAPRFPAVGASGHNRGVAGPAGYHSPACYPSVSRIGSRRLGGILSHAGGARLYARLVHLRLAGSAAS